MHTRRTATRQLPAVNRLVERIHGCISQRPFLAQPRARRLTVDPPLLSGVPLELDPSRGPPTFADRRGRLRLIVSVVGLVILDRPHIDPQRVVLGKSVSFLFY